MPSPFESSEYSVERAKHHIAQLERETKIFLESSPYTQVTEVNADRTEDILKIKLTKRMPRAIPGIAFDALNNLRSALDQAGHTIAVAAGENGKKAHFPFGDTPADVQGHAKGRGRSNQLPKDIFDLMVSFKPYKGGDDLLWALNKLCNAQKHETIIPIGMASGSASTGPISYPGRISFQVPRWDRAKNEMIIARVERGFTYDINFQVRMFIALAKVDVVDGKPVSTVLNQITSIVESIIMALEAEARRLKLFP